MAQTIVTGLTEADLHVLPGLRHYTPIEAPAEIAKIITLTMAKFTAPHAKEN
jgi:pimeloyl-ACP methyl ester carboxylesterase